jgi:DNA topoisomerase-2
VHKIDFAYRGPNDEKQLDLVFNKKKVAERKEWLENFRPGTHVDHKVTKLPYEDFINKEFILFSIADCVRSIPSIMDGFKPGHRKILFACFKRNLKNEIKVAQLAGYVAEHSAYHHGEQSLQVLYSHSIPRPDSASQSTIVGMAQTFVGKNNINLLYPSGMFGTRLQGGKDAASARYIYTRLCHVTRAVFHVDDDALLDYLDEDGQSIEPKYYAPVIPMVRYTFLNLSTHPATGARKRLGGYWHRLVHFNSHVRPAGDHRQPPSAACRRRTCRHATVVPRLQGPYRH